MIRGGDFYAVWVEELGLWSTDEDDVSRMIDRELDKFAEENRSKFDANVKILYMWDSESGMIDSWHKFCQKQMRDSFHMLDENLIFSNSATNKKDYASKRVVSQHGISLFQLYILQRRDIRLNGLSVRLYLVIQKLCRSLWFYMVQQVRVNRQS